MSLEEAAAKARHAANRLRHLSMRYSGALVELVRGEQAGFLPTGHPGLREARDFIDLILFTRAEVNALARLLIDAGLLTAEQVQAQFAEEYEWFAQQKAKALGVEVHDHGLTFKADTARERRKESN
jgi:hypothetical protein